MFRDGYDESAIENIGERVPWEETPLRCLHACFLQRSTEEDLRTGAHAGRPILEETGMQDRSVRGRLKRRLRGHLAPQTSAWKNEKYMRGDLVSVDAAPFFPVR